MIPFEAEIFTGRQARESWPTHPFAGRADQGARLKRLCVHSMNA